MPAFSYNRSFRRRQRANRPPCGRRQPPAHCTLNRVLTHAYDLPGDHRLLCPRARQHNTSTAEGCNVPGASPELKRAAACFPAQSTARKYWCRCSSPGGIEDGGRRPRLRRLPGCAATCCAAMAKLLCTGGVASNPCRRAAGRSTGGGRLYGGGEQPSGWQSRSQRLAATVLSVPQVNAKRG